MPDEPEAYQGVAKPTDIGNPNMGLISRIHDLMETWFREHLHNTPLSQETQLLNRVRTGFDKLKRDIEKEIR